MPDQRSLRFAEWTRDEARSAPPDLLFVLPVGATEQHGHHLPLGTDTFHLEHVVNAAARQASEHIAITVTPTLPYGCSDHHLPYGGTMSLSSETMLRVGKELIRSLVGSGARYLFVVNGHGGNRDVLRLLARDAALEAEASIAVAEWWEPAAAELAGARSELRARVPGHAGAFETSIALAVNPDLVREPPADRPSLPEIATAAGEARNSYSSEAHGRWLTFDGYTDYPGEGTARHGCEYVETAITALAAAFTDFVTARQALTVATEKEAK
jgi:creatinine amidohydrolase